MSQQSGRSVPPQSPKSRGQDAHWMFCAYHLSRASIAEVPLAACAPVKWNVARTVELVLDRLDALEARREAFEPIVASRAFNHSRLFAAALGHLDRLHRRAQEFAAKGEALWRSANATRTGMRKLVADMDSDGFIVEGMMVPRRRGDSARSVGNELLELVQFGEQNRACLEEYDRDLAARLHDARLQAELLLTAVGDLDAPSVVREVRNSHLRASALFLQEWRGLRELLATHGCDEHELEQLAPAL